MDLSCLGSYIQHPLPIYNIFNSSLDDYLYLNYLTPLPELTILQSRASILLMIYPFPVFSILFLSSVMPRSHFNYSSPNEQNIKEMKNSYPCHMHSTCTELASVNYSTIFN